MYGYAYEGDTNYPLPFAINNTNSCIAIYLTSGGNVRVATGSNRSNMTGAVVLEYTKTTD